MTAKKTVAPDPKKAAAETPKKAKAAKPAADPKDTKALKVASGKAATTAAAAPAAAKSSAKAAPVKAAPAKPAAKGKPAAKTAGKAPKGRTAQAIGDSIRRRGAGRDRYDAATHAFVMLDVDRELDRIYGDSRGSGAGALLRLIVRHARAAWQDRIDRVALVGGGIADEPNVGRNPPE